MKRHILLIFCVLFGLIAMAKPPQLNLDKLFDGSYNANKSVSINIHKNSRAYYRGFTVTDNAALVKKITEIFLKDARNADESQEIVQNGGVEYRSLKIHNNGKTIDIGLSYTPGHYPGNHCYLFIQGPPEAFK